MIDFQENPVAAPADHGDGFAPDEAPATSERRRTDVNGLDVTTGRAAFASTRSAYHGQGQRIEPGDSIAVIARKAGLDWRIESSPIHYGVAGEHAMRVNPVQRQLYRSDTGDELSVVSRNRFHVVQPIDVLGFYKQACDERGVRIETAGALKGGRLVWAQVNTGESFRLGGIDRVDLYAFAATGCDLRTGTTVGGSSLRFECGNTVNVGLADARAAGTTISQRHSRALDMDDLRRQLGIAIEGARGFEEHANLLAEKPVSRTDAAEAFAEVVRPASTRDGSPTPRQARADERAIAALFEAMAKSPGSDLVTARGTWWGWLQAVTFKYTHEVRVRGTAASAELARFASSETGEGARVKERALALALEA